MKVYKYERILGIYQALMNGALISKEDMATRFKVDTRTIQRDIDDIRAFLADAKIFDVQLSEHQVIYDREQGGYRVN